ncbi:class III lanthionine synthetase LanKC [Mammaliicoccus sciuri]|uniref:class III lanthionine synthetase LanKC n=1 Tax=Mammaliicoccus sciuri TaxID=1296 RepID=UPI001E35B44A|nr:class III lanthionine synthetase LanKC [Mammaliicoccus sciuri]MCD8772001.1 class III lanthionine synthetase LanKC [Mammaliicoccus sciuri]
MQPIKNSVHNQLLPFNKNTYESTESYMPNLDYIKYTFNLVNEFDGYIKNNGLWTYIEFKNNKLPNQGWKIHISANLDNDIEILKIVTKYCSGNKVSFKHLSDKNMLIFLNGKYINRGSAGKFITIYPNDFEVFEKTLENLYKLLKNFEGPYILSDKRYKGCKVLYYRYGGIVGKTALNYRGEQEYYLTSPHGSKVADSRYAYWNPPYWITDPFEKIEDNEDEDELLNGRYEIDSVIEFSSDGGVYLALDTYNNTKVVIKEARPHTAFDNSGNDAIDRLLNEYDKLKELEHFQNTPIVIEKFYAWEHLFLVEEYISGETLNTYMMSISPIMNNSFGKNEVYNFNINLKNIFLNICENIKRIHDKNIILQDLSPRNIMINSNNKRLTFIDLETAYNNKKEKATTVRTPGFFNVDEKEEDNFKVEIKNLSFLYFSLIFPINSLFTLDSSKLFVFLDSFVDYGVLSPDIANIIKKINTGELKDIKHIEDLLENVNPDKISKLKSGENYNVIMNDLIDGIEKGITSEMKEINKFEKFACDPMGLFTNKISMAYGASGVIFSLVSNNKKKYELDKIVSWIIHKAQRTELAPCLFNGYSGISYTLSDLKYFDICEFLMKKANSSKIKTDSFDLFYGISGLGLTNLKLYKDTGNEYYLNQAIKIGDELLQSAKLNDKNNAYWPDKNDSVYLGLGRGSSGVALYLLYLYLETKNENYIEYGIKAIKFEIDNLYFDKSGKISILRGELDNQESVQSPYLYDGASGIGSVLLRYKNFLDEDEYKSILNGLLKESLRKYVAFPSLMRGLSGIGHFILDCYLFEKETLYMDKAFEILDTLNDFSIKENEIVYFAGEQLFRYSSDYSTGAAGVLTFLNRLNNFDSNPYNYNFYLDHHFKDDFNI